MLNANAMQQNSVFGALQIGYVPQYNGFGYQVYYGIKNEVRLGVGAPYSKQLETAL